MAKMLKKDELEFINGYIVDKGTNEIVLPDSKVTRDLNNIEQAWQRAKYLAAQPKGAAAPTLDGFEFKSTATLPKVDKPKTPVSDDRTAEAMAFMAEIELIEEADKVNGLVERYKELFEFVSEDYVVDCGIGLVKLDLATVGNPLELTSDKLLAILKDIMAAPCVTV
jgi:hypothetical protein